MSETGAGVERRGPGAGPEGSGGQTAGSGSVAERPLQSETEAGAEEDMTEGGGAGPQSACGA